MEIMTISIDKVIKVEERKRTVTATMDTSTYGGRAKGEVYSFLKDLWRALQVCGYFWKSSDLTGKMRFASKPCQMTSGTDRNMKRKSATLQMRELRQSLTVASISVRSTIWLSR